VALQQLCQLSVFCCGLTFLADSVDDDDDAEPADVATAITAGLFASNSSLSALHEPVTIC